jgi:hypothetical protein
MLTRESCECSLASLEVGSSRRDREHLLKGFSMLSLLRECFYKPLTTQRLQRCVVPDTHVLTKSNIPAFRQHVTIFIFRLCPLAAWSSPVLKRMYTLQLVRESVGLIHQFLFKNSKHANLTIVLLIFPFFV